LGVKVIDYKLQQTQMPPAQRCCLLMNVTEVRLNDYADVLSPVNRESISCMNVRWRVYVW